MARVMVGVEVDVWVVKYAWSQGVFKIRAIISPNGFAREALPRGVGRVLTKSEYATTKKEAAVKAKRLIEAKKKALRKTLQKLNALKLEIPD